jgi:hypothetical protein
MKRWISSPLKFQGSTTLMEPRAGYLLGFVVLLANLGLAKGQHYLWDIPNVDVPNKVRVGEAFSQRGSLTVLVPKTSQHRPN